MRRMLLFLVVVALLVPIAAVQTQGQNTQGQKTLDVYYIDTDGGKAVLFASPTGELQSFAIQSCSCGSIAERL